mmetsp:Transcript_14017/g.42381  ORF Transcript_14017/g.42381 Transcript_14017/m.42381 type:complete len:130 (+) Transcript_14017:37-426(+)
MARTSKTSSGRRRKERLTARLRKRPARGTAKQRSIPYACYRDMLESKNAEIARLEQAKDATIAALGEANGMLRTELAAEPRVDNSVNTHFVIQLVGEASTKIDVRVGSSDTCNVQHITAPANHLALPRS